MSKRKHHSNLLIFPATILASSGREHAYTFDNLPPIRDEYIGKILAIKVKRAYIETGDYTIEGAEDRITIERKELSDAYRTFTAGHDRFERELERMQSIDHSYVIIESDLRTFMSPGASIPGWQSRANPRSVYGSLIAWQYRFPRTQWVFAGSRRLGEIYAFSVLDRAVREGILDPR